MDTVLGVRLVEIQVIMSLLPAAFESRKWTYLLCKRVRMKRHVVDSELEGDTCYAYIFAFV